MFNQIVRDLVALLAASMHMTPRDFVTRGSSLVASDPCVRRWQDLCRGLAVATGQDVIAMAMQIAAATEPNAAVEIQLPPGDCYLRVGPARPEPGSVRETRQLLGGHHGSIFADLDQNYRLLGLEILQEAS